MDMAESNKPLQLVVIGVLALLTLLALALIFTDLQGWM